MKKDLGLEADILPGKGGMFDVIVDGKLIFSKYTEDRFPETGEITVKIRELGNL